MSYAGFEMFKNSCWGFAMESCFSCFTYGLWLQNSGLNISLGAVLPGRAWGLKPPPPLGKLCPLIAEFRYFLSGMVRWVEMPERKN